MPQPLPPRRHGCGVWELVHVFESDGPETRFGGETRLEARHFCISGDALHELSWALVVVERPEPGQVDDAVGSGAPRVRGAGLAGGVNCDDDGGKGVLAARLRGGRPTRAVPAQGTGSGAVGTGQPFGVAEASGGA